MWWRASMLRCVITRGIQYTASYTPSCSLHTCNEHTSWNTSKYCTLVNSLPQYWNPSSIRSDLQGEGNSRHEETTLEAWTSLLSHRLWLLMGYMDRLSGYGIHIYRVLYGVNSSYRCHRYYTFYMVWVWYGLFTVSASDCIKVLF